jgi:HK97 family phage portal protein
MQIEQIRTPYGFEAKTSLNTVIGWLTADEQATNVGAPILWREQSVFHQCVSLRASAIQGMPWSIYSTGEEPIWTSDNGAVPRNLQWASDLPRLLYLWEASLCSVGAAYSLIERRRGVSGLHYYNPANITPMADAARGIYAYRRQVQQRTETIPAQDMFAMFTPDPFKEIGPGSSEGDAAARNARILRAVEGFLQNHMDTGLIKRTILTIDSEGKPQPEELSRLEKFWNEFIGGWKRAPAKVMSKNVKPHVIGEGLADMKTGEINEEQRKGIAAGFGIPYSLVSSSAANFATKASDQVDFYTLTVTPRARMIQREMNRQLFSQFGMEFVFEPWKIEVMQQTELQKAQAITSVVGRPVLTVNEGRALLGYDPLEEMEDGEVVVQPPQDEEAVTDEQKAELAAWRRRATRKGINARFNPERLTTKQATIVRQRLSSGEPVDTAFSPPFNAGF